MNHIITQKSAPRHPHRVGGGQSDYVTPARVRRDALALRFCGLASPVLAVVVSRHAHSLAPPSIGLFLQLSELLLFILELRADGQLWRDGVRAFTAGAKGGRSAWHALQW